MSKLFAAFVLSLVMVMVVSAIILLCGYHDAAKAFSYLGTPLIMLGWVGYIAAVDSRKRWPNVGWYTRMSRLLTFCR